MDKSIVKTRLGHYWTPGSGAQTALVVFASEDTVNLSVWDSEGDAFQRVDVPITGHEDAEGKASFHLVSLCPTECPEHIG